MYNNSGFSLKLPDDPLNELVVPFPWGAHFRGRDPGRETELLAAQGNVVDPRSRSSEEGCLFGWQLLRLNDREGLRGFDVWCAYGATRRHIPFL